MMGMEDQRRHVPHRAAEKLFPQLDFSMQPPTQELVVRDLHDNTWTFRHTYRGIDTNKILRISFLHWLSCVLILLTGQVKLTYIIVRMLYAPFLISLLCSMSSNRIYSKFLQCS